MKIEKQGRTFSYYIKHITPLLIAALMLELIGRFLAERAMMSVIPEGDTLYFSWSVRVVLFLMIGWRFIFTLHEKARVAAKAGLIAGGMVGLVIGLFEVIWYHNLNAWIIFIALPWQTMLLGFIVSGGVGYFFKRFKSERDAYLNTKKQ